MSATGECFENIIGLSRKDCPCVETRPVEAGVSASGLYLDELEGLRIKLIDRAQDCGEDGLWAMMDRARSNAIESLKADLGACLVDNTDPARPSGISEIGDPKNATASGHNLNNVYHGLTVQTARVKGGRFRVLAIATAFKGVVPTTIDLKVYSRSEFGSDVIATYTLPIVNNQVVWTEIAPLELSMSEYSTADSRFYFVFEPPTNLMKAMNSEISCGCGGQYKPTFNIERPQYLSRNQHGGKLWVDWAMAAGTYGNSLSGRETWTRVNATQGIMLRVQFECDITTSFCSDTPNYQYDNTQKVIAHAVRYKAGFNLVTDIINSGSVNRLSTLGGDELRNTRANYRKEYEKRVMDYLCPTLADPMHVNKYGDCLRCKDKWGFSQGTIRN